MRLLYLHHHRRRRRRLRPTVISMITWIYSYNSWAIVCIRVCCPCIRPMHRKLPACCWNCRQPICWRFWRQKNRCDWNPTKLWTLLCTNNVLILVCWWREMVFEIILIMSCGIQIIQLEAVQHRVPQVVAENEWIRLLCWRIVNWKIMRRYFMHRANVDFTVHDKDRLRSNGLTRSEMLDGKFVWLFLLFTKCLKLKWIIIDNGTILKDYEYNTGHVPYLNSSY